ncbi:hypothetical protein [Sphingomonas sp.]|uniref:hypothetical protein n=1 Tax=Sphingomonas sp. TaxID=28214 RepID=UPI0026013200|nr:hypothetical protein [Sphingomonas sp.]
MTNLTEIEAPPLARRTILNVTALALAAAVAILLVAVLPAEFHRDPTGLGKATGIAALWAPEETVVTATQSGQPAQRSYSTPFRSDTLDIDLGDSDRQDGREAVEYKVRVTKGSTFLYTWQVVRIADPQEFYTEFHGHTVVAGRSMTVANYRKATGASDNGVLTAPFDGVHGWYFQNQSAGPVKVRLRLSGFYTLIPDGLPGNEAGLHASPVR